MTNGTYSGISLSDFFSLIHVYNSTPTPLGTPCYYGRERNSECLPVGRYMAQMLLVCLSYPITVVIQYVTLLAHSCITWVNSAVISQAHYILEMYLGSIDHPRAEPECDQPSRPVDTPVFSIDRGLGQGCALIALSPVLRQRCELVARFQSFGRSGTFAKRNHSTAAPVVTRLRRDLSRAAVA
jgi:hypothetical protein